MSYKLTSSDTGSVHNVIYRIAGNFCEVKYSLFLWGKLTSTKFSPPKLRLGLPNACNVVHACN